MWGVVRDIDKKFKKEKKKKKTSKEDHCSTGPLTFRV